jgi:hypothetical protein
VTAFKERAHDVRCQKGQSNERCEVALSDYEAFGHCLDAVVRSRQQLFLGSRNLAAFGGLPAPVSGRDFPMSGIFRSVPTQTGSILAAFSRCRHYVGFWHAYAIRLCTQLRQPVYLGSLGGSLPQPRPSICTCAVQAWGRACVRQAGVRDCWW